MKKFFILLSIGFCFKVSDVAADNDCVVIHYNKYCVVKDGVLSITKDEIIQVNDRDGEKYTSFSISFTKKNKIHDFSATIENLQGNVIRKIKRGEYTDISSVSGEELYSDNLVRKFHVKYNIYPYRIHIHYKQVYDEFKSIVDFTPFIDKRVLTKSADLIVEVPKGYSVIFKQYRASPPDESTNDGIHRLTWHTTYTPADFTQILTPPAEEVLPEIVVLPEKFMYGTEGSLKSWASFGEWFYNLNKNRDQLTFQEKMKVDELIKGCNNDREIIDKLYHYLQDNTRYVDVSIDIGGFQTYPAQYVCNNKYGDCKALTNYMKALLKEADIPSYFVLVRAGDKILNPYRNFPYTKFNHVILCVPLKQDTVWLECTSNSLPTGYLGIGTQNRWALLIDSSNSHLVKTPALTPQQVINTYTYRINIDDAGNAIISINLKARGELFEVLKNISYGLTDHEKNDFIRNRLGFSSFDLLNWKITQPNRDSSYVIFTARLKEKNLTEDYGSEAMLSLVSDMIPNFERPTRRTLPVCISYPEAEADTFLITYPASWQPDTNFKTNNYSSYFIDYSSGASLKGKMIRFTSNYCLKAGYYTLKDYPDFFNALLKVSKLDRTNVLVFKK